MAALNRLTQSIVVSLLGGLLLSITVSGRFTSYVRPGFAPLLIIGGVVLMAVGAVSLVLALRAEARADKAGSSHRPESPGAPGLSGAPGSLGSSGTEHPTTATDAHGHDHDASKAPWLILVPVLVLLLVAPPALGADAVSRNAASQGIAGMDVLERADPASSEPVDGWLEGGYRFNDGSGSVGGARESTRTQQFPPLPEGIEPALPIKDFVLRALYDADGSVDGVPVTVTGFVASPGDGFADGYTIARIVISCCAADANPMRIHVADNPPFPLDTWVQAVVTAVPNSGTRANGYVPTVTVTSITPVHQPADPYEH